MPPSVEQPQPIIIPLALFQELDKQLIDLLSGLSNDDWNRPTVCSEWTVKDIAAHLLDGSMRRISSLRDSYRPPESPQFFDSHASLMSYLHELNATWTKAARRISPKLLIELLETVNRECSQLLGSLDPFAPASIPVGWAGEEQSQNWFDVAREYTEKWHHQQQIADATARSGAILTRRFYHPVLDTFMRALPYCFRDVPAPAGTIVRTTVTGDAGGDWYLVRCGAAWLLSESVDADQTPSASITFDPDTAWRVLTKRMDAEQVLKQFPSIVLEGDQNLARRVLETVSIMA